MAGKKKSDTPKYDALSRKERQFIDAYMAEQASGKGELKRVAQRVGWSYSYTRQIAMLPWVEEALKERCGEVDQIIKDLVAAAVDASQPIIDRIGRMQRLSKVIDDEEEQTGNRLRALELLGRMHGDYLDRVQNEGDPNKPIVHRVDLEDRIRRKRSEDPPEVEDLLS